MVLCARIPSQALINLVGALGGSWHGRIAMCRCPAHADRTPSLSLRQGDRGILVTCFAGCSREDVLRALRHVQTDRHYPVSDWRQAPLLSNIQRLWDQALDAGGTLAERYLDRRHLMPVPPDIRFHPQCPYLPRPRTIFRPALLIPVREMSRLVAIQRIFLDPHTAHYERKVMLGSPASGAWRGRAGRATLAIAEGFETAEAFFRLHGIDCWACLGARRMDQIVIPADVTRLIIAEDNDVEGRQAAARAQCRYDRSGLRIERMPPPPIFNDWADVLQAQGADA